MQSGIRSKTKTFVLKSRPEDLVLTNLDIAKYSELSDEMSEAQIVEAIMQGLEDYKAERQDAVSHPLHHLQTPHSNGRRRPPCGRPCLHP